MTYAALVFTVMAGLVAAISRGRMRRWIAGTGPAMTIC
jgi:hypothetical protein